MQLFVSAVDSRWRVHATNHLGWWSPDRRGSDAGSCYIENARVPEEADGVCCEGLRKACVGIAYGDVSPCICTTAPCGTEEKQPPANVPCCEGIRIECTSVGTSSNVQCICGTPGADAGGD